MTRKNKILLWGFVLSPFIVLFGLVQLTALGVFGDLPTFDQLENPKNNLATEIISEDGVVLGKYFFENSTEECANIFLYSNILLISLNRN